MSGEPVDAPFGERLREAMDGRGPLCAGIDPHAGLLDAWGLTDSVNGLEKFARTAVEALGPRVAVVKPQSAFFERFGSAGIAVLERVVETAHQAGALVVLDVKRGDIGSTSQAYADAYLDPRSPLFCDAVTASPYLGFGSLDPLLAKARAHNAGVFVLALTSNPEAPSVQHARTVDGHSVAGGVLTALAEVNAGVPLSDALSACARAIELPALTRAIDQLVGALDRGTPLVGVLRAQAQDAREEEKRTLLEAAGKKEVAMLVPLVFGVLPVTIAFAIFPATLVLQLGF